MLLVWPPPPDLTRRVHVLLAYTTLWYVLQVPRAATNNDLLGLLGLFAKTRETSVLFQAGALGITIHEVGGHVVVADFKANQDGTPGQAEKSGVIGIGDRYVGPCDQVPR